MQNLILILTIPLIAYLSSCKDNFPTIEPKERCIVVLTEKSDNGFKGYCRCHLYQWNMDAVGRVGGSTNYDLSKCDKLIGYSIDDTVEIYEWQEKIRFWLKRRLDK